MAAGDATNPLFQTLNATTAPAVAQVGFITDAEADDKIYKTTLGPNMLFAKDGYIFVYQDVRGKFMSEGEFIAVKPFNTAKKTN